MPLPSIGSILGDQMTSEVSSSYNSLSGSDIRAVIGHIPFAEIQAVSFSITREKAPVYTMGSPDVRAFSRNKRGIAGSLIWINFDRHALLNVVRRAAGKFIANIDDIRPQFRTAESQFMLETAIFDAQTTRGNGIPVGATIDEASMPRVYGISGVAGGFKESATPWYSDQILPFDITLAGANEIGAAASMKIFGVEILNEGNGVSIDDAVSEMQATFVARMVEPWMAVATPFKMPSTGGM